MTQNIDKNAVKTPKKHQLGRINGLDFARFLAFFGMVFVNFKIVMLPMDADLGNSAWFFSLLEGRAAALFVILAGIGLGLSVQIAKLNHETGTGDFTVSTLKKGVFLFIIGLLNALIFSADILHYYGIYFIFAAFLAPLSTSILKYIVIALIVTATILLLALDFDSGWNWQTYEYEGFFTLEGGLTNLFYNGWHPVLPWLGFLLFGVILSRINLTNKAVQKKMIFIGLGITIISYFVSSSIISALFESNDKELEALVPLFSMGPIPATIFYMISSTATACAIIAASIIFTKKFAQLPIVKAVNIAGRQSLTLYIAHIYLGMGIMEVAGLLGNSSVSAGILTSILFVFIISVGCNIWSNYFKHGPLEIIMRKIAG
ncbi:MAG: DUF418 domain-containing protein [Rhizobiales bacterium]|nr:DUF418 domain-containing protein [Hyphomicrobiales bacterium]